MVKLVAIQWGSVFKPTIRIRDSARCFDNEKRPKDVVWLMSLGRPKNAIRRQSSVVF